MTMFRVPHATSAGTAHLITLLGIGVAGYHEFAAYRPPSPLLPGRKDAMSFKRIRIDAGWFVLLGALLFAAAGRAQEVSIGIVPSLIKDLSEGQQKFIRGEFPILVKEFTGLDGKLV